jgi:hypothetical protein
MSTAGNVRGSNFYYYDFHISYCCEQFGHLIQNPLYLLAEVFSSGSAHFNWDSQSWIKITIV